MAAGLIPLVRLHLDEYKARAMPARHSHSNSDISQRHVAAHLIPLVRLHLDACRARAMPAHHSHSNIEINGQEATKFFDKKPRNECEEQKQKSLAFWVGLPQILLDNIISYDCV